MSTRAVIARANGDGFQGRYHHFDGYPTGLGAELFKLYNTGFKHDLSRMLQVIIDEHPAGWSSLQDANWHKKPGYVNGSMEEDNRPRCYCHGDRHENEYLITDQSSTDCEYAYVFHERDHRMVVLGHNGFENDDYSKGRDLWEVLAIANLDEPEPNWKEMEG